MTQVKGHWRERDGKRSWIPSFFRKGTRTSTVYQEEDSSEFTHQDKKYNLNKTLRRTAFKKVREVPVKDLRWALKDWKEYKEDPRAHKKRVDKADTSAPLLVAKLEDGTPVPIDGMHRLAKAIREKRETVPARIVSDANLDSALLPDEDAPGIPDRKRFKEIPKTKGQKWSLAVQEHDAHRAGKHLDVRLVTGEDAHSWAVRRMPGPGETVLAVQQPTHTAEYATWSGRIGEGEYGAGSVRLRRDGPIDVISSGPDKVVFNQYDGKRTEEYALVRTGDKNWIFLNRSTVPGKYDFPRAKESYKSRKFGPEVAEEEGILQPKVDGAHAMVVLQSGRRPRIFSYRTSKKGDVLEYTHKVPGFFHQRVPKGVGKVVLRAEIYLADEKGGALDASRTAGILNAGILKARELQKGTGGLKVMPFDIVGMEDKPYSERLAKLKTIISGMSGLREPETATTLRAKRKLVHRIQSKKHPLTEEGVVLWQKNKPIKAKIVDDADVYVREVFPGKGKHKGRAGGFTYSLTPEGPVVGKVGTGFSDALRDELWKHRTELVGKAGTLTYQKKTSKGTLYAPRFLRWHPDKN